MLLRRCVALRLELGTGERELLALVVELTFIVLLLTGGVRFEL